MPGYCPNSSGAPTGPVQNLNTLSDRHALGTSNACPTTAPGTSNPDLRVLAATVVAGLALCETNGRAGDQRVWVRVVSGWVHPRYRRSGSVFRRAFLVAWVALGRLWAVTT